MPVRMALQGLRPREEGAAARPADLRRVPVDACRSAPVIMS
jgi:hypothetical protein